MTPAAPAAVPRALGLAAAQLGEGRTGNSDAAVDHGRAPGRSARRGQDPAVQVEQAGHVGCVDPPHPALGADPPLARASGRGAEGRVDALDLPVGRARSLVGPVVGDDREVQLGVRAGPNPQRGSK